MVRNSLFGAVKLNANPDFDSCSYFWYGISFDVCGTFSLPNGNFGKNVEIFGVDLSSFLYIDDKQRYLNSW